MAKIPVYYVTSKARYVPGNTLSPAELEELRMPGAPPRHNPNPGVDVAKFFLREHAEAHLATLPAGSDYGVEERLEDEADQHESHRAPGPKGEPAATKLHAMQAETRRERRKGEVLKSYPTLVAPGLPPAETPVNLPSPLPPAAALPEFDGAKEREAEGTGEANVEAKHFDEVDDEWADSPRVEVEVIEGEDPAPNTP